MEASAFISTSEPHSTAINTQGVQPVASPGKTKDAKVVRASTQNNAQNPSTGKRMKANEEISRRQEHGVLHRFEKRTFGLIFDTEPFWILGLHSNMVESVISFK